MFDFEKCLEKYGFVADFDSTESIAELMQIDEAENPDWFDDYYESLIDFAKEKRLIEYIYKEGEHSEIFFAEKIETVIDYIEENFYTDDGYNLEKDAIKSDITEYEPLPTISEILEKINVRNVFFSEMFGIPSRTLEDWKSGKRKAADYTIKMIVELLRLKFHYDEIKDIKYYY